MNLIAIECSTNICSVASFKDDCLINVIESDNALSHSKNLPLMFKSIISDFNNLKEDIDCFAISIGPGSFTSLRISLSFVKGLAFGLKKRIIPVPTIESLATSINNNSKYHIVIDSYRDKCFIQEFDGLKYISEPSIRLISDLDEIKSDIYGYSDTISKINQVTPSAILVGQYAINNESNLIKNYNMDDINPIYLSDTEYVKIDDTGSK